MFGKKLIGSGLSLVFWLGASLVSAVRGQVLPFDHWLNLYVEAAASAPWDKCDRSVWPQERRAVAALGSGYSHVLPPWAAAIVREELRREAEAEAAQWDAWRIGIVGLTGARPVAKAKGGGYFLEGEGRIRLAAHVDAYVRVRATPDSAEVPAFTGHPRKKRRLGGLNAAECDYAFLEYRTTWLSARFGRFKESWGPGDAQSVWLSAWGPAYDGVLIELRYFRFRFRALSTYLETVRDTGGKDNVHRYLAGHFLSYSNGGTLHLGVGEGMLYAGVDRPLSLAYSNPFMAYQEYERNARTNELSKNRDNWFLTGWWEWFPWPRLRTWGMVMIDDVQLDREPIPDATAVRAGMSYRLGGPEGGVLRWDYVRVSSWTYRHQTPHINYVARGLPLGFSGGSDLEQHELSWLGFPWRWTTARGFLRLGWQGELSILDDLYRLREFPHHWDFPWGVVEKSTEVGVALRYQRWRNVVVDAGVSWRRRDNAGHVVGERRTEVEGFVAVGVWGEVPLGALMGGDGGNR